MLRVITMCGRDGGGRDSNGSIVSSITMCGEDSSGGSGSVPHPPHSLVLPCPTLQTSLQLVVAHSYVMVWNPLGYNVSWRQIDFQCQT